MTPSALQERLNSSRRAEYRGATVASAFAGAPAELAALLGGCGVYDLGFRTRISLTGADRVRWLNGMVTNNIRDLAQGQGVYAFLLNPQGHILGDLHAYNLRRVDDRRNRSQPGGKDSGDLRSLHHHG